jgi:hypothetical protein
MCRTLNPDVTVYSNGPVPSDPDTQAALAKVQATGIKLDERRIKRLVNNGVGPEKGITLEFETGPSVSKKPPIFGAPAGMMLIAMGLPTGHGGHADAQAADT